MVKPNNMKMPPGGQILKNQILFYRLIRDRVVTWFPLCFRSYYIALSQLRVSRHKRIMP